MVAVWPGAYAKGFIPKERVRRARNRGPDGWCIVHGCTSFYPRRTRGVSVTLGEVKVVNKAALTGDSEQEDDGARRGRIGQTSVDRLSLFVRIASRLALISHATLRGWSSVPPHAARSCLFIIADRSSSSAQVKRTLVQDLGRSAVGSRHLAEGTRRCQTGYTPFKADPGRPFGAPHEGRRQR